MHTLLAKQQASHPASVENDYVVYVDDFTNPTKVTGYRSDNIWFDATGKVDDPSIITQESDNVTPYLKDDTQKGRSVIKHLKIMSQKRYMPRISFSFPISDDAQFFAHYLMSLLNVHQPQIDWTQRNIFI